MSSTNTTFQEQPLARNIMMWDGRLQKAATRLGFIPYPTRYELVTDDQMVRLIPYTMLPSRYRHWSFGKRYEEQAKNFGGHIFEAVINSSPSFCYLGTTNLMPMQVLVMGHATYGHVVFFKQNFLFAESGAPYIIEKLAQHGEFVKSLQDDPTYGVQKVEYILDAAHALDDHVGWLPSVAGKVKDSELRKMLEAELLNLMQRRNGSISEFEKAGLSEQIKELENQLRRDPITPTDDILGYIIKNNARLSDKERGLLAIVRDEARYLQPQARTKIMNEGVASFTEKYILLQPEVGIAGTSWALEMASYWSMHDRTASDFYFNPYTLGLRIVEEIVETKCTEEFEAEVERPTFTTRPATEEDENDEFAIKALNGEIIEWTGELERVKIMQKDLTPLHNVIAHHEDKTFIRQFLTEELIEKINEKALHWLQRTLRMISQLLVSRGFNPQLAAPDPLPYSLEDLMGIIEKWMELAEAGEQMMQMGMPPFPVPQQTLKTMATIIQIVASFDADRKKFRKMMVMRTGYHSVPVIKIVDGGPLSLNDNTGTLTLYHVFDPDFGFLKQSECRDTTKYAVRVWGRPVRLITMEQQEDRFGRPVGQPRPYEYLCDEDGEVRERWLTKE
jgi:stage V sporulation protein R